MPYIQRIYNIEEDYSLYISLGIVDANENYIITQLLDLESFLPVLRIYKRGANFYSFAHSQFKFTTLFDDGTFVKFISKSENTFILKEASYFTLYMILPHSIVVNATDYTYLQQHNYLNNTLYYGIWVKNYTKAELTSTLEITFIPYN